MATGDIGIQDPGGHSAVPVRRFRVKKTTESAAINAGEPVKIASVGKVYVVPLADGDLLVNAPYFVGIAAAASNATSSAEGTVDVYLDLPGVVYKARPKTAANASTQAAIDDRRWYRVVIDLTSSAYTVDAAAADSVANGLVIIDGNVNNGEFYFVVAEAATWRMWARDAI